jgi:hypothetical protein
METGLDDMDWIDLVQDGYSTSESIVNMVDLLHGVI